MTEVREFLDEPVAEEKLHAFLGNVAAGEGVNSYDDFLSLVNNSQLALSIGSMIEHHGNPNPKVDGQTRINGQSEGWKFTAFNENREYHIGTTISQSRRNRKYIIGPRDVSLVLFNRYAIKGAMAFEYTVSSHVMYLIDNANPETHEAWSRLGNIPMYTYFGDSDVPSKVTTPVKMATETRLHAAETISGFLDISSKLVKQLLRVSGKVDN